MPELACCLITRDLCSALHYLHSQVSYSPRLRLFCILLTFRVLFTAQSELPIFSSQTLEPRFLGVSGKTLHGGQVFENDIQGTALHCTRLVRADQTCTTFPFTELLGTSPGWLLKYCNRTSLATTKPVTSTAWRSPCVRWQTASCHSVKCRPL